MSTTGANQSAISSHLGAVPRLLPGLALLWQARDAGGRSDRRDARRVVTGAALQSAGLTKPDVEFLLGEGYAEVIDVGGRGTRLAPDVLSDQTQFVLTSTGEMLVERFLQAFGEFRLRVDSRAPRSPGRSHVVLRPHWDRQRRELRFGPVVVKRFGTTAPNQELLLSAFEDLGWPEGIDDPLPSTGGGRPVPRLQHTILRLNRTLKQPLIHFDRDSSGRRVTWRYVGSCNASSSGTGVAWGLLIG